MSNRDPKTYRKRKFDTIRQITAWNMAMGGSLNRLKLRSMQTGRHVGESE